MKKILSIALSVLMVFTSLSVACSAAAPEEELNFAVASDLHYNVPEEELTASGEIDDEIYWYANRRAALENESGVIIDEFLRQCAENDKVDFVLVPGDLADNGKIVLQEHYDVAAKFKKFEEETGKQIYVTVGNHDAGLNCDTTLDVFKEIYADFGFDQALTVSGCSYTADLGSKYRLIALDSTDPDKSTADGMSAEKMDWVRIQAQQAKADGRYPILMMHHNLLDHMPLQSIFSKDFIVQFHYSTADLLANWGIKLVFTGHEHCSDATVYTSSIGNKIYDFATTSLTMYPLQYRTFEITDDEINYEAQTIEKIDTDALTSMVNGYSQAQLDLMNADMNAYGKGYLKAGVQWRLERSFKMEQMGIAEDAIYYSLVKTAVDGLIKVLDDPLYGECGLQQLAAEYNIDIPDSDYENGWDVATELVAAHYEGEENYDFDSLEVTIFLRLVALLLRDDLSTVADEVFFKAANDIFANFGTDAFITDITKMATKVLGAVTPVEYLLLAIVSPIIYNFAVDTDGVNDNYGVIEGYGVSNVSGNISNVYAKIANMVKTLYKYFTLIIDNLLKIIKL